MKRYEAIARLAGDLAAARDSTEVARAMLAHGIPAMEAHAGAIHVFGPDGVLVPLAVSGVPAAQQQAYTPLVASGEAPVVDVARGGAAMFFESRAAMARTYPAMAEVLARGSRNAWAILPLVADDQHLGAVTFEFDRERDFSDEVRDFAAVLAVLSAQAIARGRLHDAATRDAARQRLLSEASAELAKSLAWDATLTASARIALGGFADACIVDLLAAVVPDAGDERITRAAVEAVDPAVAERLRARTDDAAVLEVIQTGHARFVADGTALIAPLTARGWTRGALWFVSEGSGRRFDRSDVAFAVEIAHRAAMAIESAALVREMARAHDELEIRARRSRILADISARLVEAGGNRAAAIESAARAVARELGDVCVVQVLRPDGSFEPVAIHHATNPEAEAVARQALIGASVPASGRMAELLSTRATIFIPRVVSSGFHPSAQQANPYVERFGVTSMILAPIQAHGRFLGTLGVTRDRGGGAYSEEDRRIVEDVAARLALALENARLHEDAQRARADAEAASRAKDEFLAMLGHELRNPLAPIVTAVELMKRRLPPDAVTRERAMIERQAQHLVRLVDDLLDVSRITRGKIELRREEIELAEIVAKGLEMAAPVVEARRQQVTVSVPAQGLPVLVDPARMAQVIANLLTNAAKYTDGPGEITISAARDGEDVVLRVRDTGVGIPAELLPRIFDLFTQGSRSIDRSQGGLGLGLAIVRSLTELHGGSVSADSAGPGQGSELVVRLPLVGASPHQSAAQPPAGARAGPPRMRVLVVDDNVDAADALADALTLIGHETRTVYDGQRALEAIREFSPQWVLLDIGLPVLDGYEVARRVRQSGGGVPRLVALTGYGQAHDRERAMAAGFDVHLVKPVDLDALTALLR